MILSFKTKINGKPTYFPEKILSGLLKELEITGYKEFHNTPDFIYEYGNFAGYEYADSILEKVDNIKPKLHTIRKDKNNRWKIDVMIDFFINARQKNMFRFAPRIPVVSHQSIVISNSDQGFKVSIDGRHLEQEEIKILAINDGFENLSDFVNYFNHQLKNCFFIGKIIHWTDLRY